jgi:hypothetical protein
MGAAFEPHLQSAPDAVHLQAEPQLQGMFGLIKLGWLGEGGGGMAWEEARGVRV